MSLLKKLINQGMILGTSAFIYMAINCAINLIRQKRFRFINAKIIIVSRRFDLLMIEVELNDEYKSIIKAISIFKIRVNFIDVKED